jgi:hypothetical protein
MSGNDLMGKLAKAGNHLARKAPISLACALTEKYLELRGRSQDQRDKSALELAKWVTMKPGGRAEKYLNHFLGGSGNPVEFTMKDLLSEDSLVSTRVEMELLRKLPALSNKSTPADIVNPRTKVGSERHEWSVDPCITIFQKNFSNQDWWYALGTFNINWKVLQTSAQHHYVKVWGENEYKWHPEEDRITQCLHQAGDRLAHTGKGRNFMMRSIPGVVVLSETRRKMIETISVHSFNPNNNSPSISLEGLKARISN